MATLARPAVGWTNYGFPVGPLTTPSGHETYKGFELEPATPTIGAYVSGIRLNGKIDSEVFSELRRALLEWKVLFFRDQDISSQEQREFAELWGELETHPLIELTHTETSIGDTAPESVDVTRSATDAMLPGNNNNWHSDVTFCQKPSFGAVLRAVEIPDVGGDTLWADVVTAYDTLPAAVKHKIDLLSARHDGTESVGYLLPPGMVEKFKTAYSSAEHPVVRLIPETGRRALFVNPMYTECILGVGDTESAELLSLLYRHISRPEFQVRLTWQKDTVAMWDNRICQHYAMNDYFPKQRIMNRIAIAGDKPIGITGR